MLHHFHEPMRDPVRGRVGAQVFDSVKWVAVSPRRAVGGVMLIAQVE
jgi:hypothetical protein